YRRATQAGRRLVPGALEALAHPQIRKELALASGKPDHVKARQLCRQLLDVRAKLALQPMEHIEPRLDPEFFRGVMAPPAGCQNDKILLHRLELFGINQRCIQQLAEIMFMISDIVIEREAELCAHMKVFVAPYWLVTRLFQMHIGR